MTVTQRILVVEDELLLFDEMREELEERGAEVLGPAPSVTDAFAVLSAGPRPDAAILDVNLSGEMVYPFADFLQSSGIPFVFVTGYSDQVIPQTFAQVLKFEKPVTMQMVLKGLRLAKQQVA